MRATPWVLHVTRLALALASTLHTRRDEGRYGATICPKCGSEYREGVRVCPDCGERLVEHASSTATPTRGQPSEPRGLVEVHQSAQPMHGDLIRIHLEEAGIPCVLFSDETVGLFAQSFLPRVMVPAEVAEARAEEIREIIASVEGDAGPTPRTRYLIRVPQGYLILLVLLAGITGLPLSVLSLVTGEPWERLWGAVGTAGSLLFGWFGVGQYVHQRRARAADEAALEEEADAAHAPDRPTRADAD